MDVLSILINLAGSEMLLWVVLETLGFKLIHQFMSIFLLLILGLPTHFSIIHSQQLYH
jgi:hypothetical protein